MVNLGGEQLYLFDLIPGETQSKFRYDYYRELFDESKASTLDASKNEETYDSSKKSSSESNELNKSVEISSENSTQKLSK